MLLAAPAARSAWNLPCEHNITCSDLIMLETQQSPLAWLPWPMVEKEHHQIFTHEHYIHQEDDQLSILAHLGAIHLPLSLRLCPLHDENSDFAESWLSSLVSVSMVWFQVVFDAATDHQLESRLGSAF